MKKRRSKEQIRRMRMRRRRIRRIIISLFLIVLMLILGVAAYLYTRYRAAYDSDFDSSSIEVNEDVDTEHTDGYTTIALFGLDTDGVDNLDSGGRSDSIIIATINNDTNEVKLASVYRDNYFQLPDGTYTKANAAYAKGGPEEAISMLNINLDLNIEKYIAIDYNALIDVVDALGGIDVELTATEIDHMNNYMIDIAKATGKSYTDLQEVSGTYTLTGIQATAYCRVRYTAGDDFKRTERHRIVIEKILEKAKTTDVATLTSIVNSVTSEVKTNLTISEITSLVSDVNDYDLSETTGFPFTKATPTIDSVSYVVACGLSYNVSQLHEFLYGESDYEVSSDLEDISEDIQYITGVQTEEIEDSDTTDSTDTAVQ